MEQTMHCFSHYLSVVGYSRGTQRMIDSCVRDFTGERFEAVISITAQDIKDYYEWLHIRPLKRGSGALSGMMISHYVYSLKVFFGWLQQSGQISHNPISGLQFESPDYQRRQPLARVGIQALFTVAATARERALLHLFYSCGLRRSEGVRLRLGDVHFKDRLLYVRCGKGQRRRVVPLPDKVAAALLAYVTEERSGSDAGFLLSADGNAMSGRQCLSLLKTLLVKAQLPGSVTLHDLRRSVATHLLQSGMPLEQVRDFLGHRHLETTQIYAQPSAEQIRSL